MNRNGSEPTLPDWEEADLKLLEDIREVAASRYRATETSQQDLLRADLEVSNVLNDLIRLRQQMATGQARLARLLHIAPQSQLLALDELPPDPSLHDLDQLQQLAVAQRPELDSPLPAGGSKIGKRKDDA